MSAPHERRLVTSAVLDPPVDVAERGRGRWFAVLAVIADVAFASRLVPVLHGSGLWGLTGYDGGVYYAAAAGLAHGRLPYVDFLLLHPPGILLALAPFGLLGRVVGHPDTQAVARLAWMGLGTLSALLVALTLRCRGPAVALVGGLLYAVWVPAIHVERTTALEALTGVLTMGAVLLLTRPAARALGPRGAVVAGLLLGAATATKIWGAAPLLVLAASPAWATDYASLVGAPIALLAGTATGTVRRWWAGRWAGSFVPVAAVLALVAGYAVVSAPETTFGERFPGRSLAAVVADLPGCVTSDDPAVLVAADVLGRNLERGCPLMVDLGGYSYHLQPGASARTSRPDNAQWQQFVLDYESSGTANVVVRFEDGGTTRATRRTIESWPVIGYAGRHPVRQAPR